MRSSNRLLSVLAMAGLLIGPIGCDSPELPQFEPLEAVFLPLEGRIGVALNVVPQAVFSDALNPSSVRAETVFLEYQLCPEAGDCLCDQAEWLQTAGTAEVDGATLSYHQPSGDLTESWLVARACYQFVCTTAVSGQTQGPLRDLWIPGHPGVGVLQRFWTAAQ